MRSTDDRELLGRVVGFYERTLRESPEALAYLDRRGLRHPELVDTFRLGFANRTLGYRLPQKNRQAGAQLRGRLQRLGVLRESGHEHLAGSLVVPILDADGGVVQLYGRKLRDDLRAGTPLHLYLPGPHRGVFNSAALAASREVVVCESLIDALSFWCHGQRHVTATYGVGGFTDEHLAAFKQHDVERVLVAYDGDDAGDQGAASLAERLGGEGIECSRVLFPAGIDANAMITSVDDPAGALAGLLAGAVPIGSGPSAARRPTPTSPEPGVGDPEPVRPAGSEEKEPDRPPDSFPAAEPPVLAASRGVELAGEELRVGIEDRRWRVRGLSKVTSSTRCG